MSQNSIAIIYGSDTGATESVAKSFESNRPSRCLHARVAYRAGENSREIYTKYSQFKHSLLMAKKQEAEKANGKSQQQHHPTELAGGQEKGDDRSGRFDPHSVE